MCRWLGRNWGGTHFKRYWTPNNRSKAIEGMGTQVNARWSGKEIVLVGGAKRMDRFVEMDK